MKETEMNQTEQNDLKQDRHNWLESMGKEIKEICAKYKCLLYGTTTVIDGDWNTYGYITFEGEAVLPLATDDLVASPEKHELE